MITDKFIYSAPMKYWQPPKGNPLVGMVLNNPERYSHYTFTPKRDGEWARIIVDENKKVMIQSRTLSTVTGEYTDKSDKVPHVVEELLKFLPKNTVLIGELAFEDVSKTSRNVGSILRSLTPLALEKQEKGPKLHLYVFDCLMWDGEDFSKSKYETRFLTNRYIDWFFNYLVEVHFYTHLVKPRPVTELEDFLASYFAIGGEGVVLMDKNSLYANGSRPVRMSVKIKKQVAEFEGKVVGFIEPTKEYKGNNIDNWSYFEDGMAVTKPYAMGWKSGVIVQYKTITFSVTSGMTDDDRTWCSTSEAQQLLEEGKLYAVCGAMEFTEDSARHPYLVRLRTDM